MLAGSRARFRVQKTGWLGKLLTVGLLVVVLTFSLLVFAVIATGAALAAGYLWWKTREVRQQMAMRTPSASGQIIEGEIISKVREQPAPPASPAP
jgi:hypothetical protein